MNLKTRHCVWWWGVYVCEMGTVQQTELTLVSFLAKNTVQKLVFCIDGKVTHTHTHTSRWKTCLWTWNVIWLSCSWEGLTGLTDTLTPLRYISGMHAMSQMSHVIDWRMHCLSERSLLSIYSQREGEGGVQDRMHGQHMVTFGWLSPPPLSWVGNELSCCLVKHKSLHVTLDSLRAARDDLAPHLGRLALQPSSQDYFCKLVDIDGCFFLLWLKCIVLGIHIWVGKVSRASFLSK